MSVPIVGTPSLLSAGKMIIGVDMSSVAKNGCLISIFALAFCMRFMRCPFNYWWLVKPFNKARFAIHTWNSSGGVR
jgi:hypothetical protein